MHSNKAQHIRQQGDAPNRASEPDTSSAAPKPATNDPKGDSSPRKGFHRRGGTQARHAPRALGQHTKRVLMVAALVVALVVGLAIGSGGLVTQGASRVDATTIKNSFSDVAELATQEYDYTDVGKFSQDDMKILDLSIPFTGRSFLVTYSGTVKAGIADMSEAEVSVDDASRTVNVTLPQVTVLDSHIDNNSVETYDQTFNPINQISVDDITGFLSSEESARESDAVNGGILDKARSRAEDLVTSNIRALLSTTAEKDYTVNVTWQTDSTDGGQTQDGSDTATSSDSDTSDSAASGSEATGSDAGSQS